MNTEVTHRAGLHQDHEKPARSLLRSQVSCCKNTPIIYRPGSRARMLAGRWLTMARALESPLISSSYLTKAEFRGPKPIN